MCQALSAKFLGQEHGIEAGVTELFEDIHREFLVVVVNFLGYFLELFLCKFAGKCFQVQLFLCKSILVVHVFSFLL